MIIKMIMTIVTHLDSVPCWLCRMVSSSTTGCIASLFPVSVTERCITVACSDSLESVYHYNTILYYTPYSILSIYLCTIISSIAAILLGTISDKNIIMTNLGLYRNRITTLLWCFLPTKANHTPMTSLTQLTSSRVVICTFSFIH